MPRKRIVMPLNERSPFLVSGIPDEETVIGIWLKLSQICCSHASWRPMSLMHHLLKQLSQPRPSATSATIFDVKILSWIFEGGIAEPATTKSCDRISSFPSKIAKLPFPKRETLPPNHQLAMSPNCPPPLGSSVYALSM